MNAAKPNAEETGAKAVQSAIDSAWVPPSRSRSNACRSANGSLLFPRSSDLTGIAAGLTVGGIAVGAPALGFPVPIHSVRPTHTIRPSKIAKCAHT